MRSQSKEVLDMKTPRRRNLVRALSLRMLILWSATTLLLTAVGYSYAATAREVDMSADFALERFYKEVKGAGEFAKVAKGMLVLPNVYKGGFIVGAEYGEGALRVGGKTVDYYSVAAGSFGLQIGGEKKDIVILFMTQEALSEFRAGSGWEAGVDGNLAIAEIGTGGRLDTTTLKESIVAFVFGVRGIMADISLKGCKFTKIRLGD
jgi:lipid-binding SYLF domain-containing protein